MGQAWLVPTLPTLLGQLTEYKSNAKSITLYPRPSVTDIRFCKGLLHLFLTQQNAGYLWPESRHLKSGPPNKETSLRDYMTILGLETVFLSVLQSQN